MLIERCTAEDFDGVFVLMQQLWPTKPLDPASLRQMFADAIAAPSRVLLCMRDDDRVLGFGSMTFKPHNWYAGEIGWIDELVVDETQRGRGIGQSLLGRLIAIAQERNCKAIELDSAFHRTEAHAFYEKLGFTSRAFLYHKLL